ncbi:MAG: ribonuclease III [Pseudomonadota bacterium]
MVTKRQTLAEWAALTLGHEFRNTQRLKEAVTHPSLSQRNSYQRLEFLGDRVLGLVVADQLLKHFADEQEGVIARRFTKLVRKETLADVARAIGIPAQIELENSARHAKVHLQDGVCSDVMEALIGALYLDAGLPAVDRFIERHWQTLLEAETGASKDPKTRLQEWAQGRSLRLPEYVVTARHGPDHAPVFEIEVRVDGFAPVRAEAGSKRDAEKRAATAIWDQAIAPRA